MPPTPRRWLDRTQPERLQQACIGLYITAAFDALNGLGGGGAGGFMLLIAAAKVAGGYGIANERKAGYIAGVAAASVSVLLALIVVVATGGFNQILALFALVIDVIILSFLLNSTSRDYQRIWFK